MKYKGEKESKEGNFAQIKDVSTVQMYTRIVQNDILKACHKLFDPFNAEWLLDCTTPKTFTFEGYGGKTGTCHI